MSAEDLQRFGWRLLRGAAPDLAAVLLILLALALTGGVVACLWLARRRFR